MSRQAIVLVSALLLALPASAEIFKCVAKNGLDLYQNFPCQFESMGWVPDAPNTKAAPSPASARATEARSVAAETGNVARGSVDAQNPNAPREIAMGMTFEDVRKRWGEPEETTLEEPGQGSRYEVWTYANARTVRFDHKGRVSAIKQ